MVVPFITTELLEREHHTSESNLLKTRHVALSAPSMCAPQAAQGLAGAILTLQVNPPHFPVSHPLCSRRIFRENSPGSDIISNSHDANWRIEQLKG